MLKKIFVWGSIAFLVFFVAFRPSAAADYLGTLGRTASDIVLGVGDFFDWLVGN